MISIYNANTEQIALNHFKAIQEYINKKETRVVKEKHIAWLKKYLNISLEELIIAKPSILEKIKIDYDLLDSDIKANCPFRQSYKNFYTNNFSSTSSKLKLNGRQYNGYELINMLEIETCPYCNRNTIHNAKKSRTSEFDHFFDKRTYPIFAMSFYNLIPSCKVCNQLKKDKKDKVINPYDDRYHVENEAVFEIKINSAKYLHSKDGFDLKYVAKKKSKIKDEISNATELFQINDLYQYHKDYVLEIIQKEAVYSPEYIDDLFKQFEGTLFKNREDVLRMIGSNYFYQNELLKRPLSKLTQDIFNQLDI